MKNIKKLLLINNGYPSTKFPNYCTYIETINNCIIKAGLVTSVLAIKYSRNSLLHKFFNYSKFWIICLFKNLNKFDYIYINHLPNCIPILFNLTLKPSKTIIHWHGNDLVGTSLLIKITRYFINKKVKNFINIVPSTFFRNKLNKYYEVDKNKLFISPSGGVNINIFKPFNDKQDNKYYTIGFSSGLLQDKGADILLELARRSKDIENHLGKKIKFTLINYGKEADKYISQLKKLPITLNILKKMPKSSMPKFYNNIDILLFPSQKESLGLIALEAMSCGKPVIAFNHCAFPEFIIQNVSGELINKNLEKEILINEFIKKISFIIKNKNQYNPRKIIVDKYSENSVINFYKNLFDY